jgi:DNA-binding sugar fermentation-stimulating protein
LPFGGRDNETVRSQVTLGDSRVDYVIENSDSDVSDIILEVKVG